ncbi:MAG TPA: tetratricopeptide repeat protein [Bryobacteraceae bacterium]|nr:tetratricopeptide repeat protein [Bryobacteraceae bacterium]
MLLAQSEVAKQPQPKSQKEVEALMAIQNAQDADARIAAIDNLLKNFADTEFKVALLQLAAASAQQKGDIDKMIIYSERALEADANSYQAMLMIASGTAQRTREHDLDREEKLKTVEKYARSAVDLIAKAPRPRPDITEEQWTGAKKDLTAQAYETLGHAATVRKNYAGAIENYRKAIEIASTPDPATLVRLASALNETGKYDEALATLDKLNAIQNVHPTITQAASGQRQRAMKGKGGAAAGPTAGSGTAAGTSGIPGTPTPAPTPAPAKP